MLKQESWLGASFHITYNWKFISIVYIRMQIVQKYKIDLFKKLIEIWHNFGPLRAQNYIIYNWKFIFIVQIRMPKIMSYTIESSFF